MPIADTKVTPYYAVIFTSTRTEGDNGYGEMAQTMAALAAQQPGFLGVESAREELGITVSYWESLDAIAALEAQQRTSDRTKARARPMVCVVQDAHLQGRTRLRLFNGVSDLAEPSI